MKSLQLRPDGLQVSAICLGSAYFGTKISREIAFEILDTYYDHGGRFIDTSNNYAGWLPGAVGGESERVIGAWMKARKVRDEIFLATKVGFDYPGIEQGTSRSRVLSECRKSLQNLGVDHIDLYFAHLDDRSTPLEETLGAFNTLIQEGKVRWIGASNFSAWRMESARQVSTANDFSDFVALQNHFTYLKPRPEVDWSPNVVMNNEHFDFAREHRIRLLAYYALQKGAYSRSDRPLWESYQTEENQQRLARLRLVADDLGATLHQTVLAWMRHLEPAVLPITTASRKEHLLENLGALEVEISPEQMDFLNFSDIKIR